MCTALQVGSKLSWVGSSSIQYSPSTIVVCSFILELAPYTHDASVVSARGPLISSLDVNTVMGYNSTTITPKSSRTVFLIF